nr:DUF1289 domain-containing protein [Aliagarivorans taiwanensis]
MRIDKQASAVESPCVRNCCLNEQDICLGCYRHIDEIVRWSAASDQEKLAILAKCEQHSKPFEAT